MVVNGRVVLPNKMLFVPLTQHWQLAIYVDVTTHMRPI
jgi:hypothetical protein